MTTTTTTKSQDIIMELYNEYMLFTYSQKEPLSMRTTECVKALMHYQTLSHNRHCLMPPSDSVLCLIVIQHVLLSSDTRHYPMVKSTSVCSQSNWLDQTLSYNSAWQWIWAFIQPVESSVTDHSCPGWRCAGWLECWGMSPRCLSSCPPAVLQDTSL